MRRRDVLIGASGAAAGTLFWSASARAQQNGKPYRVAYLALLPGEDATYGRSVLARLQELGYRDGQNMVWDYRSAEGRTERLPELAAELVRTNPDVLIAGFGTLAPKAAAAATRTTPIVFTAVGDPVGVGLVRSLREPGGNATGMSALASDLVAKRLQLIDGLIPGKRGVAVLANPETPYTAIALAQLRDAAGLMSLPYAMYEVRQANDVARAIENAVAAGAGSMLVLEDPVLLGALRQIIDGLARARLPAIFGPRECAEAGGLIAYGTDGVQLSRRAADLVDRILKGASPASLPVEQPTKFELVVNLKTARALGIEISPTLLASADAVID